MSTVTTVEPRYLELFFHFPWDFEIAGFYCSCKHYSESAFDKSHDEDMSEMSGKSGKGGWKITATSDKK